MTAQQSRDIENIIINNIASFANLETVEVSLEDHLKEDLYLDLSADLPLVIGNIARGLRVELESDVISSFITEAQNDPQKAIVAELMALFEEEVEFNQ